MGLEIKEQFLLLTFLLMTWFLKSVMSSFVAAVNFTLKTAGDHRYPGDCHNSSEVFDMKIFFHKCPPPNNHSNSTWFYKQGEDSGEFITPWYRQIISDQWASLHLKILFTRKLVAVMVNWDGRIPDPLLGLEDKPCWSSQGLTLEKDTTILAHEEVIISPWKKGKCLNSFCLPVLQEVAQSCTAGDAEKSHSWCSGNIEGTVETV